MKSCFIIVEIIIYSYNSPIDCQKKVEQAIVLIWMEMDGDGDDNEENNKNNKNHVLFASSSSCLSDEKQKKTENLYCTIGPNEETEQIQYLTNMDKELTKLYLKNKNALLYFYTDKGEPEGYDIKLNNVSTESWKK